MNRESRRLLVDVGRDGGFWRNAAKSGPSSGPGNNFRTIPIDSFTKRFHGRPRTTGTYDVVAWTGLDWQQFGVERRAE